MKYRVYGWIDNVYVELGQSRTHIGAAIIRRKFKKAGFEWVTITNEEPFGKVVKL